MDAKQLEAQTKKAISEALQMKQSIRNTSATNAANLLTEYLKTQPMNTNLVDKAKEQLMPLAKEFEKLYEWVMFGDQTKAREEAKLEPIILTGTEEKK